MFASRQHAEKLLGYFTRMEAENGHEENIDGVDCAREWVELIAMESPPNDRVAALLTRVDSRSGGGSAWIDLQLGVTTWARRKGFTVAGD